MDNCKCKVVAIVAQTSAGKDTIYKEVMDICNVARPIISDTTRPIRDGEIDGVEYNFISKEEFAIKLNNEGYIEYRTYNTKFGAWYYGVSKSAINTSAGCVYVVIVDVSGYQQLVNFLGRENVESIYIEAEPDLRLIRSIQRQQDTIANEFLHFNFETVEEIVRRFRDDAYKFNKFSTQADHVFSNNFNGDFVTVARKISQIINDIHKKL